MSVRATERLIGDVVTVPALPKPPQMVVKAINEKTKLITTVWFTAANQFQEGTFPSSSLDRVSQTKPPKSKKAPPPKKRGRK